jgi:hypothetical protein
MRPHRADRPDPRNIRTVCPVCRGDGATVYPRLTIITAYGPIRGYEVKPCTFCDGREWLPGLVAPA